MNNEIRNDGGPVNMGDKVVEVNNLKMYFPITRGFFQKKVGDIKAVDDVNFNIRKNETPGLWARAVAERLLQEGVFYVFTDQPAVRLILTASIFQLFRKVN